MTIIDESRIEIPDTGGFRWKELPKRQRKARSGRVRRLEIHFPTLRANPGRWARLRTYADMTGAWHACRKMREHPDAQGLEFEQRGCEVYGRAKP